MPFGYISSAPNQKQLHHTTIGLSDPKTVDVYYNVALLLICKLLWFGITGTVALNKLKSLTNVSMTYLILLNDLFNIVSDRLSIWHQHMQCQSRPWKVNNFRAHTDI